jgi:phosphomannomutase
MSRLFGTDGVRGLANDELTADLALRLAQAASQVLTQGRHADEVRREGRKPRAIVARDPRISGEFLTAAVSAGLASSGIDVLDAGVLPTPATAFLVNDILRLWRTFCVNYENRTSDADEAAKAKRKLTHYKLSHSRLLTCYSGIVTLLDTFGRKGTVSRDDVRELVAKTPRERIAEVGKASHPSEKTATEVLDSYERFLERTDVDEPTLRQRFLVKNYARERMEEARQFAELIHNLVTSIDAGRLSRAIVV